MRLPALILASVLLAGCASEGDDAPDADGDGIPDRVETQPHLIHVQLLDGPATRQVTSNPNSVDSDADGLPDNVEYAYGTDPSDPDTDGDGLLDGADLTLDPGSPQALALRARGILERAPGAFLGELSRCTLFGGTKPDAASSDRPLPDGLADGEELLGWNVTIRGLTRHVVSDPCLADGDDDRLPDHLERESGADPTVADSDGDGVMDGIDADPTADLSLLLRDVEATTPNGTRPILRFQVGSESQVLGEGFAGPVAIALDDQTSERGSLPVTLFVTATDPDGRPLSLTPHGPGLVLRIDLLKGTSAVEDAPQEPRTRLSFEGPDGALAFSWAAQRR